MIKILEGFTSNIIILLFYIFLKCVLLFPFTSYPCKWLMMNDWCLIYVFRTLFSSGTALKSRTENRWQVQHNLASMLRCQRSWVPPPATSQSPSPSTAANSSSQHFARLMLKVNGSKLHFNHIVVLMWNAWHLQQDNSCQGHCTKSGWSGRHLSEFPAFLPPS